MRAVATFDVRLVLARCHTLSFKSKNFCQYVFKILIFLTKLEKYALVFCKKIPSSGKIKRQALTMDNSNFCTHTFEYDNKSSKNIAAHGIDFEEAKVLWKDTNMIEAPAITHAGEKRFMVIGNLRGKMWTGIITYSDPPPKSMPLKS